MSRYTSATDQDRKEMLDAIGADSIDELFEHIPEGVRLGRSLELPDGKPETEVYDRIAGLAARIPHKVAMEMMLLCRGLDPQRAYTVGLVNQVVPTGQQVEAALKMAREMAEFSPLVLKTLKRFVTDGVLAQGPSEQSGRAQRALHEVKESEDAGEAQLAVKQKRKARFKGR